MASDSTIGVGRDEWGGRFRVRLSSLRKRPRANVGAEQQLGRCTGGFGRRGADPGGAPLLPMTRLWPEAFNSLFKAELVRNRGPRKSIDDLEIAVAEYIDWFDHRRLHGAIGSSHRSSTKTTTTVINPAPTTVDESLQSLH